MVPCASSWFIHPGGSVGKSPRARMLGGRGLYLLKLVPRILVQARCSSTSCILVRVSTYRNNVKRIVRWPTIFHCYYFPLLQFSTVTACQCFHMELHQFVDMLPDARQSYSGVDQVQGWGLRYINGLVVLRIILYSPASFFISIVFLHIARPLSGFMFQDVGQFLSFSHLILTTTL